MPPDMPESRDAPLPGGFRLATATPSHFAVVADLFAALHGYNADLDSCFALADNWHDLLEDYFFRTWEDPQTLWLLAWADDQPAGLLIVKAHLDSPLFQHRYWTELMAIYVKPEYRGAKLAERLVHAARDWTAAHGGARLQLYVTASNERARAFYQRCGLYPVQEIWRLDVEPAPNPALLAEDRDTELLEPGHHHFLGNGCPPRE